MIRPTLNRGAALLAKATPTRGAQARVAKYCKADRSLISKWRAGKCKPSMLYRPRLKRHLGIDLQEWERNR